MEIKLFCEVTGSRPTISVLVDQQPVASTVDWTPDKYGNISITIIADVLERSTVSICVDEMSNSSKFNIVEMIADDVLFGIVTFMCATVEGKLSTQLNNNGIINIELKSPSWSYWCAKFNQFNYKDFPFGSAN